MLFLITSRTYEADTALQISYQRFESRALKHTNKEKNAEEQKNPHKIFCYGNSARSIFSLSE